MQLSVHWNYATSRRSARPTVGRLAAAPQRLLRHVSPCKARELMFLSERITAQEAERIGLVNRVVDEGDVLDAALAVAEKIATKSPMTMKLLKRALRGHACVCCTSSRTGDDRLVLYSRNAHEDAAPSWRSAPGETSALPAHGGLATPLARRLAAHVGIDLATVAESGPGGRIMADEVNAAATASKEVAKVPGEPMGTVRGSVRPLGDCCRASFLER